MPDVEYTVFAKGEHQETTVGRDARQGGTLVHCLGIEDQFARAKLHGFGVKTLLVEVILHLTETSDKLYAVVNGVLVFEVGATVVERFTVRSPEWETLELRRVVLDVGYFVALHVIGYQVALGVVHLNLVGVGNMKGLYGLVGGVDDEGEPRVPRRIDTS